MDQNEAPICVAVVVCNDVIEDKRTHNKSLIGIFNAIAAPNVPATHPRMVVLASITNADREVPIQLVLRKPSGGDVMRVDGRVPMQDKLAVMDVVFELNGIPLEEFGTYIIDILSGSNFLGSRRFQVIAARMNQ